MHQIAWELGKSLSEVKSWELDEIMQWGAYFQIVAEERKAAAARARRGR